MPTRSEDSCPGEKGSTSSDLIFVGEELDRVHDTFDRINILVQQDIHDVAKKYLQHVTLGVPDKPKNHQFFHMIYSIPFNSIGRIFCGGD